MYRAIAEQVWAVLSPGVLLPALMVVGILLLWTPWRRLGKVLATAGLASALTVSAFRIDDRFALALEDRFPVPLLPTNVSGIIVLGGSVDADVARARRQTILNHNGDRLVQFAALSRSHPGARLIFTGGGHGAGDEADLSAMALRDMGVNLDRMEFERLAASTRENALFTFAMVRPAADETWVLVTSALHMPRAVGSFRQAGWNVIPYPVGFSTGGADRLPLGLTFFPFPSLIELDRIGRECISLIVYWYRGWTDGLFPGPEAPGFSVSVAKPWMR